MPNNKNLLSVACALALAMALGLASEPALATAAPEQASSPTGQSWPALTADCDTDACDDNQDNNKSDGSAMQDRGLSNRLHACGDSDYCGENHQDGKDTGDSSRA